MKNIIYWYFQENLLFFLRDQQISKEDKDWLYSQNIEAVKKVTDSIVIIFFPINLPNLVN
jgi:hypothetical protein